jgi:hypothetical protein
MSDRRAAFQERILRDQEMPADLAALLDAAGTPADPLASFGAKLIDPSAAQPVLLSHAYLNDKDRANPDIMANVAAFDDMAALTVYVVELEDGEIIGYWRGPDHTPISACALIELDTEGQFHVLPGRTLAEALLARCGRYLDTTKFAEANGRFGKIGIKIAASSPDDIPDASPRSDPKAFANAAYGRHRAPGQS